MSQGTLLLLLEGYLDGASKKMLRSRQKENPDKTYAEFFTWLTREMTPGPVEVEKNRWKRTKLSVQGNHLAMADWRNFKASLQECLEEAKPAPRTNCGTTWHNSCHSRSGNSSCGKKLLPVGKSIWSRFDPT